MAETQAIEVDFELEFKEVFHTTLNAVFLRSRGLFLVVILLMVLLAVVILAGYALGGRTAQRMDATLPLVALIPFMLLLIVGLCYYTARTSLKSSPGLSGPQHFTFSGSGVDFSSEKASSHFAWEMLHAVKETSQVFLLYHSKLVYNIIPKRAFPTSESRERFRRLAVDSLGANAKLKPE